MSKPYIRTGVYSNDAGEVFRRVFYWISNKNNGNTRRSPIDSLYSNIKIEKASDGEIIITTQYERWTRLSRFTIESNNMKFYPWFAYKIKQCFYDLYGKAHWNRNDNTEVDFLSQPSREYVNLPVFIVPCSAFYFLYETLLHRSKSLSKYNAMVVERFGGTQNDPILAQAEEQRRADLKNLKAEYDNNYHEITVKKNDEYQRMCTQLDMKYKALLDELTTKYVARRTELENLKFVD